MKLKYEDITTRKPGLVDEFVNSLPPGETFYDLGACVGTYGIMAYSRGLNVISFEVDKANYQAAVDNYFMIYGYEEGFKIFNIGISDKKKKINLKIGQSEPGGHHKTLETKTFCGHPNAIYNPNGEYIIEVEVDSLDNLIKKLKLPTPTFIKIDIDGSEYDFVKGAKQSLTNAKSIIIELYEESEYFKKILDILEKKYMFKLYKKGEELEAGLRDYWFVK